MGNVSYQGVKVVDDDTGVAEITTDNHLQTINMGQLVPEVYDNLALGYDGSDRLSTVQYKQSASVIATITIVYDGVTERILTITRT